MTEPLAQLRAVLHDHGYSLTAARQAVFESLRDQEPLGMHEIITVTARRADRASIYRTITLFEQLGIVQRLHLGWKYKIELTDRFSHHHHHLSCTVCGRIIALPEDAELERRLWQLASRYGFQADSHQLEVGGRCAACAAPACGQG